MSERIKGPAEGGTGAHDSATREAQALAELLGLETSSINYGELMFRARSELTFCRGRISGLEAERDAALAKIEEARAESAKPEAVTCPDCGADARSPKCFMDRAPGDCPRRLPLDDQPEPPAEGEAVHGA